MYTVPRLDVDFSPAAQEGTTPTTPTPRQVLLLNKLINKSTPKRSPDPSSPCSCTREVCSGGGGGCWPAEAASRGRGVGASNLPSSEDRVGLSALPLLAPAPALLGGSPAHAARTKRALRSPGAMLPAACSSYLRWPRVPPRHPDCRGWVSRAPPTRLARGGSRRLQPLRDVQCRLFPSPAPRRHWNPCSRGHTGKRRALGLVRGGPVLSAGSVHELAVRQPRVRQ